MTPQKRQQVAAVQKKKPQKLQAVGEVWTHFLKADKSYNASKNEMLLSTAACLKDF